MVERAFNEEGPLMSLDLHVGAYNHYEGGIDRDGAGGKILDRLDAQLDMLAPLGLDVLISTEAKGWFDREDTRAVELAAARLDMVPLRVLAPRHDCNVVIWINPERLRAVREHHESGHPWWHAQARVSVELEGLGERLWLFGAHFAPTVPGIRVHEAYATCDLADGRLVIGGGDFNDDGLGDSVPDRSGMAAGRRLRHLRAGGESAAGVLAAAEFGDVARLVKPDELWSEATAGFKDDAPIRCDRLYVGKRLHESARSFVTMPYRPELSDHCAVHAWLDLSAAL
jgi:endonuclease/exonuclease/phosphatase family metal-dependent hydrolase